MTPEGLARLILARADGPGRFLVALAGPPAAGKSTLAADLAARLPDARVVPMDGFHYDDRVLEARGLRSRKGAPETFDAMGFLHLLRRLRDEDEVAIPLFDRDLEISRAGADIVLPSDRILIVEGNYLLLDRAPWTQAAALFDLTVFVEVPEEELVRRLTDRWRHHGRPDAAQWIESNDLPNIRTVLTGSTPAEIVLRPA
ncbi:nucleoside triphosphate hydrolase [Neotabrizicola sp. VNH66]|uniref:nucleoside triphosphate hydrolase n=1 Tax=Neotabrizicola sp. VNH66 TaxID=3400918 RepID=UPI003C0C34E2